MVGSKELFLRLTRLILKKEFFFIVKLYVFWLVVFLVQKMLFMLFNPVESMVLPATDWLKVLYHGLPLDLSAGAYLMVIPCMLLVSAPLWRKSLLRIFLVSYVVAMLLIVLFVGVVDMNLYRYWGTKLDIMPLFYLNNPTEALASISVGEILLLVLLFVVLAIFFSAGFMRLVIGKNWHSIRYNLKSSLLALFIAMLLILPARGGVDVATINPGVVYFHQHQFANHSAVNVLWNVLYSWVEKENMLASKTFMSDEQARGLFAEIHQFSDVGSPRVIKEHANILLIVLEGFSNKIIEPLGRYNDITPYLNKLCSESLVFSNFFASGDRSDKGLVSIFSGFPSQPQSIIIKYSSKTQRLPFLTDAFHDKGYQTAFYYGGNINFANFRSYFTRASMDDIITINDFSRKIKRQKWGVPDEFVYDRILHDLDSIREPFFVSVFTLSSHDPFDVPGEPVFDRSTREALSKNGYYYADRCLGEFIEKAKQKHWWDNTLVVITSDHGSRSPGNTDGHSREKFAIPMLWLGGALLCEPSFVKTYGSQVDIASTIYNQFGFGSTSFSYSKNLLTPSANGYAYYAFNNGFGFYTSGAGMIYDNTAGKFIYRAGTHVARWHDYGKAIMQISTKDFLSK